MSSSPSPFPLSFPELFLFFLIFRLLFVNTLSKAPEIKNPSFSRLYSLLSIAHNSIANLLHSHSRHIFVVNRHTILSRQVSNRRHNLCCLTSFFLNHTKNIFTKKKKSYTHFTKSMAPLTTQETTQWFWRERT